MAETNSSIVRLTPLKHTKFVSPNQVQFKIYEVYIGEHVI